MKYLRILALAAVGFSFAVLAQTAFAYSPVLSVVSNGNGVIITISGANPNSPIQLSYVPSGSTLPTTVSNFGYTDGSGSYTTTVNSSSYGLAGASQIYVSVSGQQSNSVTVTSSGSCGYYGCSVGGLTLSQTSVSLSVGQTSYVTASMPIYNPNFYISSNSNPGVVSASVSGSQISLYGVLSGSSTVSICSSGGSVCGTVYVTVSGGTCYSGSVNCGNTVTTFFNPSNPSMYVGQSLAVSINSSAYANYGYSYSNIYYISSNSNSSVVSASVSGTVLNLYALQSGSASIVVCSNNLNVCGTLYVTVSGGTCYSGSAYCGNSLTLSQTTVSVNINQTSYVTASNYSGSLYISSNSNPGVVSTSVSGSQVALFGSSIGSSTVVVCGNYSSTQCASIYVTVANGSSSGSMSLSLSSLNIGTGQSTYVVAYNYGSSLYVSSNSNPGVVSVSVSGSQVTLSGTSVGSSTVSICGSNGSCASIYITVGNSGGGMLSLNQTSVNLSVGQSAYVSSINYNSQTLYVSSNSNPSVVSTSVSGNNINLNALTVGSSNLTICSNYYNSCATVYVTVGGGSGGSLALSQTSVSLSVGQSTYISATSYSTQNLYVSSNSNPSAVSTSVSGTSVNLTAVAVGSSNVIICSNYYNSCATVYVTVGGGNAGGSLTFSNLNPIVSVGQTTSATVNNNYNNGGLVISSNSNPNVVSVSIYGNTLNIYGIITGTSTITVCTSNSNQCGTLFVTVGNGNGSLMLSQNTLNLALYQSTTVTIYGGGLTSFYLASNSNSNVATLNISGNVINVYANNLGYAAAVICQNSTSQCSTLNINVSNSSNYYGSLSFVTSSLVAGSVGQYYNVNLQAMGGSPSYMFTVTSGTLPGGMSLASNGQLSGMPQTAGTFTFTVQVRDSSSQVASMNYSIVINGTTTSGGGLSYPGGSGSNVLGASLYSNGQLISENGTVYIVYKNTKTGFVSAAVFQGLGFKFSSVQEVGSSGLNDSGYVVRTASASHPWGSWIKSGNTVYFVHDSGLIPVPDWATFLNNGGQSNLIVPANHYDFTLPVLSPMTYSDSRLN